eukprot:scaffold1740_cov254-Pinguiococcus_pyrenoidosus.AAC.2
MDQDEEYAAFLSLLDRLYQHCDDEGQWDELQRWIEGGRVRDFAISLRSSRPDGCVDEGKHDSFPPGIYRKLLRAVSGLLACEKVKAPILNPL